MQNYYFKFLKMCKFAHDRKPLNKNKELWRKCTPEHYIPRFLVEGICKAYWFQISKKQWWVFRKNIGNVNIIGGSTKISEGWEINV